MMRRFWIGLLAGFVMLGSARPVSALVVMEPQPDRTLEWFLADSELIVRGVIREVGRREAGQGNTFEVVTVEVHETFKGDAPADGLVRFTARNLDIGRLAGGSRGTEYLFFLVRSAQHARSRPAAEALAAAWTAAPWAMRDYRAVAPIAVEGTPGDFLYTLGEGLKRLESGRAVIAAMREMLARGAGAPIDYRGEFTIRWSPDSQFIKPSPPLTPGRRLPRLPHSLVIPLDRTAEAMAHRWIRSSNPFDRHNAARILAGFKSDRSIAALKGLLDDPFTSDMHWPGPLGGFMLIQRPGKWYETRRPIRQFAWYTLSRWGAAADDAVIDQPAYPAVYLRNWHIVGGLAGLGLLMVVVLVRGWRGAGDRRRRPKILGGVGGVSLLLLIAVMTLWIRGRWRIDELVVRVGSQTRLEIASLPGGLRVMSISKWPDPYPPTLTSASRSTQSEQDWLYQDGSKAVPGRRGRAGFYRDYGSLAGPGLGRGAVYTAWTVPWWALAALFSLPAAWRVGLVIRRWQAWAPWQCGRCGYDMRGTPGRCPECGAGYGG